MLNTSLSIDTDASVDSVEGDDGAEGSVRIFWRSVLDIRKS